MMCYAAEFIHFGISSVGAVNLQRSRGGIVTYYHLSTLALAEMESYHVGLTNLDFGLQLIRIAHLRHSGEWRDASLQTA